VEIAICLRWPGSRFCLSACSQPRAVSDCCRDCAWYADFGCKGSREFDAALRRSCVHDAREWRIVEGGAVFVYSNRVSSNCGEEVVVRQLHLGCAGNLGGVEYGCADRRILRLLQS